MPDDTLHTETQCNDLVGAVSVDGWSAPPLHDLARAIGIDTEQYWPVSVAFHASGLGGQRPFFDVVVDVVDRSLFGHTFDDLSRYVSERQGRVQTIRFTRTNVDLLEILKPIKRLSIEVKRRDLDLTDIEPMEEIELDSEESGE